MKSLQRYDFSYNYDMTARDIYQEEKDFDKAIENYNKYIDLSKYNHYTISKIGCRVSTLFASPVSVLFPIFSVLNYRTRPVSLPIDLPDC